MEVSIQQETNLQFVMKPQDGVSPFLTARIIERSYSFKKPREAKIFDEDGQSVAHVHLKVGINLGPFKNGLEKQIKNLKENILGCGEWKIRKK